MNVMDLAGVWRLRCDVRNIEVDYAVPGDVHSALIAAGQIPHPYKGTDELAVRWVADEDWVATTTFTLDQLEIGEYHFDIDYLDTVATVTLNGIEVLKAENCFRWHSPDITKALKAGKNVVEVILHSNTKAANEKQTAQPFYIPYSVSNNPVPNGNMLRKPQCHFGWDWNLAIVPFGLYGRFEVHRIGQLHCHEDFRISQTHNPDGSIELHLGLFFECIPNQKMDYSVSLGDLRQDYSFTVDDKWNSIDLSIHVEKPILWWPAGHGVQHLYDIEVICGEQVIRRKIGLRQIELVTDKDEAGRRFAFKINGREIFCKQMHYPQLQQLIGHANFFLQPRMQT
jgi:beta-mannosidase